VGLVAYLVEINVLCQASGCERRAAVELRRYDNEPAGQYCRKCGATKLADLKRQEAAEWERRAQGVPRH
jgi:hypothetical protein